MVPLCTQLDYMVVFRQFFLLSVLVALLHTNYTLSIKKANLNNVIHGGFGSTWGHNFYMGTQNGSKLEI